MKALVAVLLTVWLCGAALAQKPVSIDAAPPAMEWVTRQVQAPRVTFHTFESSAAGSKVSYHVYRPAAYDRVENKDRRFPVVYWLHGSGGGLTGIAPLARQFDAAIEAGKAPPLLVVFVNGLENGMYCDWKDGTALVESVIIRDLVPHIDATERTIATREGRMLDGFSMGGYGAARLGFKHTDLFGAVSMAGAGPLQAELTQSPRVGARGREEILQRVYGGDQEYFRQVSPWRIAEQNARTIAAGSLVRQVIGDRDETFGFNRDFHEHLEQLKIPHTWTVLPGIAHEPMKLLAALGDANWEFYRAAFGEPGALKRTSAPDSPARRPNIVLIVADDLGYGETGVYGSKDIATPNVDAIAAAGVRFTDGYVTCPVCAPTRAALLTGRYQQRFGFEVNPGPAQRASDKFGLPRSERTLAEKLKEAGYATGMFGKWHLGFKEDLQPQRRGFDEFFGFLSGAHTYLPGGRKADPILRNGKPVEEKEYLTEALAREAAAFIEKNKDRPFFIYLPFNAVHAPMEAVQKYRDRFPEVTSKKRQTFAAMLSALDDGVGRVMAAVKEAGQEENTLVFFISDNGGPTPQTTSGNGVLSGFKGQVLEGGIRVPFMMKWPGHVQPGTVYARPVVSMDVHATVLAAAGWKEPALADGAKEEANDARPLEGRDLLPFVGVAGGEAKAGAGAGPHEALFWRFGNQWAVRQGDWKLLSQGNARGGRRGGAAGTGGGGGAGGANAGVRLYNLRDDIGEKNDLASELPEKVAELRKVYDAWNAKNIVPMWGRSDGGGDDENDQPAKPGGGVGGVGGTVDARVRATFESLDTDKDGFLSEAEYAKSGTTAARWPLAVIDTNKDGKLSLAEVAAAFAGTGARGGGRRPVPPKDGG